MQILARVVWSLLKTTLSWACDLTEALTVVTVNAEPRQSPESLES